MRRGVLMGAGAYLIWGLSPLFWKLLDDVPAIDLVASRAVWALVLLAVVHSVRRSWPGVVAIARQPRLLAVAAVTAGLLAVNWAVFVWAVADDRVLEASLGYFINPLVSVLLGVVVLGERMRGAQWVAVALATAGVAWFTVEVGSLPWVSLVLAGTFGVYGLLRKVAGFGAVDGLTLEMGVLAPLAVAVLIVRGAGGDAVMSVDLPVQTLLIITSGAVTAAPLLLFAASARRVPLTVVGLLQYIAPTLHFVLGVWVFGEPFDATRLVGFALIWTGVAVFAVDGWRRGVPAAPAPAGVPR